MKNYLKQAVVLLTVFGLFLTAAPTNSTTKLPVNNFQALKSGFEPDIPLKP
ncbi:MAG: hypothetical protein ACRC5C_03605 [Bacilli bacterium]